VLPNLGVRAGEQRHQRRDRLCGADLPEGVGGEAEMPPGRAGALQQRGNRGRLELEAAAPPSSATPRPGKEADEGADGLCPRSRSLDDLVALRTGFSPGSRLSSASRSSWAGRGRGAAGPRPGAPPAGPRTGAGAAPVGVFLAGAWRVLS
jgi:hypothetical protein